MPTRYKSKKGIRWRGVVKMDGRVVETRLFGTGPAAKREAAQWELDRRKELIKQTTHSALPNVLEWANKYSAYSKQQHTDKTFKSKVLSFRLFLHYTKETGILNITPALAMAFLQSQCKARSGYAANKDRKNLAAAWQWGESYIDGFPKGINPFLLVSKFKEDRSPRYVPAEDDFWKVVDVADNDQDKAMLMTCFYLGARRNEVFNLKWEDVDFLNNRVRLGTAKTKDGSIKYDWLPLPEDLKAALLRWKTNQPHKVPWVFTVLADTPSPLNNPGDPFKVRAQFMKRLCKKAGVKQFGFHSIRHLHASILYNEGSELNVVQKQLRHASPTTTAGYIKTLGYEIEHGRKVLSVIGDRRQKRMGKVLQFEQKEDPQGNSHEDLVHRLGTQS